MPHEQNFTSLVGSYYTCCDVIIFVNSKKAEINVIENSNVLTKVYYNT